MDTLSLSFRIGLPDPNFMFKAWASEPLSNILKGANIPYALPSSDPEISLLAEELNHVDLAKIEDTFTVWVFANS